MEIFDNYAILMEDSSGMYNNDECLLMGLFLIEENGEFYE